MEDELILVDPIPVSYITNMGFEIGLKDRSLNYNVVKEKDISGLFLICVGWILIKGSNVTRIYEPYYYYDFYKRLCKKYGCERLMVVNGHDEYLLNVYRKVKGKLINETKDMKGKIMI